MHQCSDLPGLDDKARSGALAGYIGFDCTAPSLHVGSLVQIMMLHWLQETGGKPVALMGGGTTMVGDPSGKDESRKLLTVAEIEANKAGIRRAFAHFVRFGDGKHDAIMPDNADWLAKLNYIDFLREVGRHFSVNRMLAMDSVKLRLEPRARAHVPRIQLHVPAGLRLHGAQQAPRRDAANGRLGPVGQHRHRHRPRPAHGARAVLRADHAAHHPGFGGENGQDRRRGDLARRDDARAVRLLAVLAQRRRRRRRPVPEAVHASTAWTKSAGSKAWPGRRSTRRRRSSPTRRPRFCICAKRRTKPPRRRAKPSRKASSPKACRRSTCRGRNSTPAWAC